MKKRKELNALIGLGESKRKKTKKGSGHRLLRTEPPGTESESSSDDDEFNNLGTVAAFGKRSYTQCCNICYPLFLFIILAACVMACAGLIWMQIALKEDLDSLKEKLRTMESSQKVSSHEIPKLSEDLKTKQRKLEEIENGDKGLSRLWFNLTEMNRKISLLDSAVNHLKANIKSASDLINLPTTVEELQKSVATIGSTLTSVQHDVKTMQTALEEREKENQHSKQTEDAGEAAESDLAVLRPPGLLQDVVDLREAVGEVNQTLELHHSWSHEQIVALRSAVSNLTQRVSAVERGSALANPHSDSVEMVQAVEDPAAVFPGMMSRDDPDSATTDATPGKSDLSAVSKATRRPRFLTPNRSKRDTGTGSPKTFTLPGVSSLKDLEAFYQHAGFGATSRGMSYHHLKKHLKKVFGVPAPDARTLERYDRDRDGMYSLTELVAAVSL